MKKLFNNKKIIYFIVFILGSLSSFSLPPYNWFLINFFTLSFFFILLVQNKNLDKKNYFFYGWLFGFGVIFSVYIDEIRNFLSMVFSINIFPSDVYYLEKMPSEINLVSVCIVFFLSLIITSLASYFPARTISKMKTTDALKYE